MGHAENKVGKPNFGTLLTKIQGNLRFHEIELPRRTYPEPKKTRLTLLQIFQLLVGCKLSKQTISSSLNQTKKKPPQPQPPQLNLHQVTAEQTCASTNK